MSGKISQGNELVQRTFIFTFFHYFQEPVVIIVIRFRWYELLDLLDQTITSSEVKVAIPANQILTNFDSYMFRKIYSLSFR